MGMRRTLEQTLYDNVTPVAVTSSTDATPIVVTANSHGFSTGDRVLIFGHTTNIAANGIYKIVKVNANSFKLTDEVTGADVAGTGAGAGASGICVKAPPVFLVSDFKNAILHVLTTGTTTCTMKVAGSLGQTSANQITYQSRMGMPNMGATATVLNPYTFLQIIDLDTGTAINGATGIAVTGTDINKQYEVNINAEKWLTVIPISWTQGALNVKLFVTSEF